MRSLDARNLTAIDTVWNTFRIEGQVTAEDVLNMNATSKLRIKTVVLGGLLEPRELASFASYCGRFAEIRIPECFEKNIFSRAVRNAAVCMLCAKFVEDHAHENEELSEIFAYSAAEAAAMENRSLAYSEHSRAEDLVYQQQVEFLQALLKGLCL